MINKNNIGELKKIQDGIEFKTLVFGNNTHMIKAVLKKGTILEHSHPQEQTGYLLKGSFQLTFDNNSNIIMPGDSWNIPGNIKHRAEILEDSTLVEIFSPIREDYLELEKRKL